MSQESVWIKNILPSVLSRPGGVEAGQAQRIFDWVGTRAQLREISNLGNIYKRFTVGFLLATNVVWVLDPPSLRKHGSLFLARSLRDRKSGKSSKSRNTSSFTYRSVLLLLQFCRNAQSFFLIEEIAVSYWMYSASLRSKAEIPNRSNSKLSSRSVWVKFLLFFAWLRICLFVILRSDIEAILPVSDYNFYD